MWVKRNIQKYHAEAADKAVKVVHCCGYDSVPADLGTTLITEHLKAKGK